MHFLKRNKLLISYFIQYSGNEFYSFSYAYELTVVVVVDLFAKLKLVTFWTQLLSALTGKLQSGTKV